MQVNKIASALYYCSLLLLTSTASAHRLCESCIPLTDLLAEAYGIEISVNKISSAVAFHNGSAVYTGSVTASQEYVDLLQPILAKATGNASHKGTLACPDTSPLSKESHFDKSIREFRLAVFSWPQKLWKSATTQDQSVQIPPLHPAVQLIQEELLALPAFKNIAQEALSEIAVGISLPSWLIGTEEACHFLTAAERTFGRLVRVESAPSSAYTAAGYELCRIAHEAFECSGPGRIMTLEYNGDLAIASIVQTPLTSWSANPVTFSARTGLTSESMIEWIDMFVDSQSPEKLILAGISTNDTLFAVALENSRATRFLGDDHSTIPPSQILALGVAQAAKEALETQADDCGEPAECEYLRRKADAIAGVYTPVEPSTWPAVGPRHVEL